MTDIYKKAFDILEQTETETDYHDIVTLILKMGYDKALLTVLERGK